MKLQDLCAALPESWVEQLTRTPKVRKLSMYQKRALLDPYQIGLMRIGEMKMSFSRFTDAQVVEIGKCSIDRTAIVVGKDCNGCCVMKFSKEACMKYNGRGYIIKGKKVIEIRSHHKQGSLEELMRAFEERGGVRLNDLDAEGLFHAFQGTRTRKCKQKGGMGFAEQSRMANCKTEETSRPWKRGERVHLRTENKKKREANIKEQNALNTIRVAKVGLIYKSSTKAVHYKQQF